MSNICAKCKHYITNRYRYNDNVCYHPVLVHTSTVSGTVFGKSCFYERSDPQGKCGREGLLYEEKQTLKQQFFTLFRKLK